MAKHHFEHPHIFKFYTFKGLKINQLTQTMKNTIPTLALLGLFAVSCKQAPNKETPEPDVDYLVDHDARVRLDSTLHSFIDSGNIAGVSALIKEKGKEVYFTSLGYRDMETKKPMERNTLVQIYSMTKPITGTALMTLYEQGKFQLDDPVSKYIPEFEHMKVYKGEDEIGNAILEDAARPITIRDLTRHTAGFANGPDMPKGLAKLMQDADALNRENTLAEMAQKLASVPLAFQPGTQWLYGPSVDVQAYLVERISGQPYGEYVREHVLDPLGLKETRYYVPEADRDRFSAMYQREGEGKLKQLPEEESKSEYFHHWPLTRGGWGLTSTIDDYMRFTQMMLHKGTLDSVTILKPETVELMAANQLPDSITERSWLPSKGRVGFGIDFAVRTAAPETPDEKNGVVGEFFWDGAASTLFWIDPKNELTAVLFVQLMPFDPIGLHKAFKDAVYGPIKPQTGTEQ